MKVFTSFPGQLFLMFLLSVGVACQPAAQNKEVVKSSDGSNIATSQVLSTSVAQQQLETDCFVCHNPNADSHDAILAPPLAGIKMKYKNATSDRSEFIERMTAFVAQPSEATAMMKGPVKRFGLMPATALDQTQIEAIVTYIYDNELPEPDWFAEHEREMHGGGGKGHGRNK